MSASTIAVDWYQWLQAQPDGSQVVEPDGSVWERGGDYWLLVRSHTVITTQELAGLLAASAEEETK